MSIICCSCLCGIYAHLKWSTSLTRSLEACLISTYTVTCWQRVASQAMAWMDCHVTVSHGVRPAHDEGHHPNAGPRGPPFPRFIPTYTSRLAIISQTGMMHGRVCHEGGSTCGIYLTVVTKRRTLMVFRRIRCYEKYTGWDWCGCHTQVSC